MKDITKYQGVIPAFYACYDKDGEISVEGVKALTRHLISKGVKGDPQESVSTSMWTSVRKYLKQ